MTRIYREKISLDSQSVKAFFEQRGRNISQDNPLTSVMYQDHNPELARQRDVFEKMRVQDLLKLHPRVRVLDIGCGIGRWATSLIQEIGSYHGIDFSLSLVEEARSRNLADNCTFDVLSAQDLRLQALPGGMAVSRVLIAGVLLYLNDNDAEQALKSAAACCEREALIYLREPIALESRLTLKDFPSKELNTRYSAIYRSPVELQELFSSTLLAAGFRMTLAEPLYPPELNNRRETEQRIYIFERP